MLLARWIGCTAWAVAALAGLAFVAPGMARAQQRTSPANRVPTLQEAIYAADEGDVLYADLYLPAIKTAIRVDRSITLVGGTYYHIEFAGPGHGRALLIGAQVVEEPDPPYANPPVHSGITASGFDLLGIMRSTVRASGYADYGRPNGACAVVADYGVSLLLINSEFHATIGGIVPEYTCAAPHSGSAAVSSWAVYAMNCSFYGGGGIGNLWDDCLCPSGPYYTVAGAPGLRADYLWHTGCTFVGGPGAWWVNYPDVGAYGPGLNVRFAFPWPTHHVR